LPERRQPDPSRCRSTCATARLSPAGYGLLVALNGLLIFLFQPASLPRALALSPPAGQLALGTLRRHGEPAAGGAF
jgi:hypothetical protein